MKGRFGALLGALLFSLVGDALADEATLLGRDVDGSPVAAYSADAVFLYDTVLDITWLRNANLEGEMDWHSARSWAEGLVVGRFGGWRLPAMLDTGAPGCDFSLGGGTDCGFHVQTKSGPTVFSELAHLYYDTLNNDGWCPVGAEVVEDCRQDWNGSLNPGPFLNLMSAVYWTERAYATDPGKAWAFVTYYGSQEPRPVQMVDWHFALAVRPGDVAAAVPEPSTFAVLTAGLALLGFAVRRSQVGIGSTSRKAARLAENGVAVVGTLRRGAPCACRTSWARTNDRSSPRRTVATARSRSAGACRPSAAGRRP